MPYFMILLIVLDSVSHIFFTYYNSHHKFLAFSSEKQPFQNVFTIRLQF